MCGIFGAITKTKNASQLVFNGLKDIEYRGYDSWGIAYWKMEDTLPAGRQGGWKIEKEVGFLPSRLSLPTSHISMGHTRWATHGGVTKANAHPHSDCSGKLVLVHNGIVENYLELKKTLKNHKFKSETDTEIVAHLLEDQLKKSNSLEEALKIVFKKLKGLNAIVAADGKSIAAAKIGSPIVVGENKDGFYIASDPNALLLQTKSLLFLEDNQLVNLDSKITLFDLSENKEIKPKLTKVSWEHVSSSLQNYPHYMLKEIHEQPEVIHKIALNLKETEKLAEVIKKAYGTFFIGCGTASYACLTGDYLFSKIAKKHVNFAVGSEFNYLEDYLTDKSLIVAVSQSGESIDVVEPISSAKKKKGSKIASLVNVLGSSLYRLSDYPVLLQAGIEKGVASTKALSAMMAHMVGLAYSLIDEPQTAQQILISTSQEIKSVLGRGKEIKSLAEKISKAEHIYVLGRGLSYPVALESALKIKEISYIHAEGFAGGELKHGVIALVEKGTPVIVYSPNDETKEAILANAQEVKARGAFVIGISDKYNPAFDYFFEIKDVGASSIIPNVVFAQLLSYYLALKLKRNPDKPRNLAKSVVVR